MVYAKITELSKQFMVYDAVKNRRKFLIKEENITMIVIKEKRFIEAEEDILVHQVNIEGIMDGKIGKQIAEKYPGTKERYVDFCDKNNFIFGRLRGQALVVREKGKYIANIFAQDRNNNTDYEALEISLKIVKEIAEKYKASVAIPFKIGCENANGEWELVQDVINKVFKGSEVVLYKAED